MKYDGSDIGKPVDRTAARVMGKGVGFIPQKRIVALHSETPLPLIPVRSNEPDLTGEKFGFFTVMGKYKKGDNKGALWSVRCICGRYATRRSKAIKNPNNSSDRCEECRYLQEQKRLEEYRRYGKNFDEDKK